MVAIDWKDEDGNIVETHTGEPPQDGKNWTRVWTPFNAGNVTGAGGSPARMGKPKPK